MIGGAAGLMLIVMIIFLIDFFDNTIKDSDALANKYKKAIIGEIQRFAGYTELTISRLQKRSHIIWQ